jgi:hypothetical protein
MRLKIVQFCCATALIAATMNAAPARAAEGEIVHDAEYYILQAQNAEKWAADDRAVDEILAAFRERNGGKLSWVRSGRKSDHLITSAVEG